MNNKKESGRLALVLIFMFWLAPNLLSRVYAEALPGEPVAGVVASANKQGGVILVDLDLKDADIKDVARALSRIGGKNIIVSEEAKAKVTLRVKDMGWRQALGMILETNGLTMVEKEDYIVITTYEKRRAAEESGDLDTKIVTLNFVDVVGIQKTLASMLTKRGKIEADVRTNSLVITDLPEVIKTVEKVATQLDTKTPQVLIEAMMMTVKLTDDERLGIEWQVQDKSRPERQVSQNFGSAFGGTAGTDYFWQLKYGLAAANLRMTLDALVNQQRADILASPRVLTLDNLAATINLNEQVPYTQTQQSTDGSSSQSALTSTQFKDVPVKLIVKPHITKDNFILMNVHMEQSFLSGFTPDNQPIIDSRSAETNVLVSDGQTIVIGGLRKKENTTTVNKVPILGDIPLLGRLFRKDVKSKADTELVIFVTPHIATNLKFADSERKQYGHIEELLEKKEPEPPLKRAEFFSLRPPSN